MSVFPARPQVHIILDLMFFNIEVLRLEPFSPLSCYCKCNDVDSKLHFLSFIIIKCLMEQNTVYTQSNINRLFIVMYGDVLVTVMFFQLYHGNKTII